MSSSLTCFRLAAGFLAAALAPHAAIADASFNLGGVSLYKFRGVDQEPRDRAVRPALQGGADVEADNGLYAGTWGTTGRFGQARVEVDAYAGKRGTLTGKLNYDVGYTHYFYPGEQTLNSGELYLGLNYEQLDLRVFRGMRRGVNQGDLHYAAAYQHPLATRWNLKLGLGYTNPRDASVRGFANYYTGVEYTVATGLALSLAVAGATHRHEADDGVRDPRGILELKKTW